MLKTRTETQTAADRVVGYLKGPDGRIGDCGAFTLWDGRAVGTYTITARWRTPRSFVSAFMVQARVYITADGPAKGRTFTGRGAGNGMILSARRMSERSR